MTQRFLPYSPERDVYRLLGVDPRVDSDELMDAWRRLARTFHPDRNGSVRAHEEMQVVNALRDLLSDPQARAVYDRERHRWLSGAVRRKSTPSPAGAAVSASSAADGRGSEAERFARAVAAGLRAFLVGLAPVRCRRCAATVGREDRRCWLCGGDPAAPEAAPGT